MREQRGLEQTLEALASYARRREDARTLLELAAEESDADALKEAAREAEALAEAVRRRKAECLFSGEADANDAFLEIHPGAGGTESQDWAEMLLRMYARWCESHGFKTQTMAFMEGEEAGIKGATIRIAGANVYGWLASESGVHRLVRISPFDSGARRHTSFASVWVYPVVDDTIEVTVNDKDLRIDTYRASGAGGQHVNKTDSAVRITHMPTGIVVQCQEDRSQHRNRDVAMAMLRSRLYEAELRKREAVKQAQNDQKTEIGWGRQIRSYVMQPYQMVKDLRSGYETSNVAAVLDGDLDDMLMRMLAVKAGGGG
jgi:peptide chain release factor 2